MREELELAGRGSVLVQSLKRSWRRSRATRGDEGQAAGAARRIEGWLKEARDEHAEYVTHGDDEVRNLFDDHYDADVSAEPHSESATLRVALMEQVLVAADRLAQRLDVELVLLIIPSRIDVCEERDIGFVDPKRFPDYDRERMTRVLAEIAERNGIEYLNLFAPFQERGACRLYFKGWDRHWNDAGQELAARLMAETMRAY